MHVLLHSAPLTLQQATTNPRLHRRLLDTHRQVFCGGHCSFLLGPCAQGSVVPSKSLFSVLSKFWQLCGGVNGDLLQENLSHTYTQSTCPCGRPLSTCTSTGDAQTQFCLSLCRVPGTWCTQVYLCPLRDSGGNGV